MKCYESEAHAANVSFVMQIESCINTIGERYPAGWCKGMFDGWHCWNHTAPGTVSFASCANLTAKQLDPDLVKDLMASKYCTPNGQWWKNEQNVEWANYTMCFPDSPNIDFGMHLQVIFTIGYAISVLLCSAALITFTILKPLRSGKTRMHQNLMASFILNSLCQIIWLQLQSALQILHENPLWCRVLHLLSIYFLLSNFAWMFSEGCYLHCIVQFPFIAERKVFLLVLVVGWGFPVLPVLVYLFLRVFCIQGAYQLSHCWTYMISDFWWCYASFAVFFQASNVIFLINIIRIVVSKTLHSAPIEQASSAKQIWATVKALVILVPLLGVQYLLSCFYRPTDPKSVFTTIFQIFYVLLTSLQGATVAIVICFLNGDVLFHLNRRWNWCKTYLHSSNHSLPNSKKYHTGRSRTSLRNSRNSANFESNEQALINGVNCIKDGEDNCAL